MPDVRLTGCGPTPVASYLCALGVLRLVAEQVDREAHGWWHGDVFVLRSRLDGDRLVTFFTDDYRPTPLVSPWNNGSGFGPDDATKSKTAYEAVRAIEQSIDARLAVYRRVIEATRRLTESAAWVSAKDAKDKGEQVTLCRNLLPDEALAWFDASVVLADELKFPPLLGSGGNVGRFDLSANFMQRVADVLGLVPRKRGQTPSKVLLRAVLFDEATPLDEGSVSQYDGGITDQGLLNPWGFVLLLEGALLFASAAARRMSSDTAALATPFMVETTRAGYPSAADEKGRGEFWAPIWRSPATFAELSRLISEGRAGVGGRQARTGLDVARAIGSLGVDRGIAEFVRHGILERNGQANVVVPLGRVRVHASRAVPLLSGLEAWVSRARAVRNPPGSIARLLVRLDEAQFALAADPSADGIPRSLRAILVAAAALEDQVLRSRTMAGWLGPIRRLHAEEWVPLLDDRSTEFGLARAIVSRRERGRADSALRPLFGDLAGTAQRVPVPGLGVLAVDRVLAEAHAELALRYPPEVPPVAHGLRGADGPSARWLGGLTSLPAPLESVVAFLRHETDDRLLAEHLRCLLLLDWSSAPSPSVDERAPAEYRPPAPPFAVLAPAFHARPIPRFDRPPRAAVSWPRMLLSGHARDVVAEGVAQLRLSGCRLLVRPDCLGSNISPARLCAALLIPLWDGDVEALVRSVARPPAQDGSRTPPTEDQEV